MSMTAMRLDESARALVIAATLVPLPTPRPINLHDVDAVPREMARVYWVHAKLLAEVRDFSRKAADGH